MDEGLALLVVGAVLAASNAVALGAARTGSCPRGTAELGRLGTLS